MAEAKITLIGFNNFMDSIGEDLFINLTFPEGIDRDLVKNNILMRGGEFEVLYSDPLFMQSAINVWSNKWYRTFKKWIEALAIDYNPLENYDRFEDSTDNSTGKDIHTGSGNIKNTNTLNSETKEDGYGTSELKVSAFDSGSYQNKELTENEYGNESDFKSDGSSNTDTTESRQIDTDHTNKHTSRIHGNIGVTTSQQMLAAQIDISRFNLVENITDIFLREFTIPIY